MDVYLDLELLKEFVSSLSQMKASIDL